MSTGAIIFCIVMAFVLGYGIGGHHAIRICDKLEELRRRGR